MRDAPEVWAISRINTTLLSCTRSKDDFFVIVDLRYKIVELESARARSWNSVLHAHVHERHADARVAA